MTHDRPLPPLPTPTPGSPRDGDELALRREADPEWVRRSWTSVPLSPPTSGPTAWLRFDWYGITGWQRVILPCNLEGWVQ